VLLILNLESDYDKILYIDLDLHHGDGVENAFIFSNKVFSFSIHKHSPGFFPGTGGYRDQGKGQGLGYCLNLPIPHKLSGEGFEEIFNYAFSRLIASFDPDIIVCVCGADVLSTDPHAAFNVGSDSYSNIISVILETRIPTVFLGGGNLFYDISFSAYYLGGYHHPSTAKLWSILTHKVISGSHQIPSLPKCIPEHEYWPLYVDDDNLSVLESEEKDDSEASNIVKTKCYIDERI
jgi:histone deacetylase 8